jgi:hypothetical protein
VENPAIEDTGRSFKMQNFISIFSFRIDSMLGISLKFNCAAKQLMWSQNYCFEAVGWLLVLFTFLVSHVSGQ